MTPAPTHGGPWRPLELVTLVLTLIALLLFHDEIEAMSLVDASRLTTAITIFATFTVIRTARRGMWSPSSVFLIILALFHVGLIAAVGVGREPASEIGESTSLWLHRSSTMTALWLTELAMVGYALGVRVAGLRPRRAERPEVDDPGLDQIVGATGAVLVIASIVLWFAITVSRGGVGILIGSYGNFLEAYEGSILAFTDRLADFGLVFLAASRWSRGHAIAIGVFVVWSVFALTLGLRGEVLFPAFAALAVLASRRLPMRTSRAVVVALALLTVIAMVRNLRKTGLKDVQWSEIGANPLDGLTEMGASLRPVSEVVFWHDLGDGFDRGATYWAPIDRALYYVIPGWDRVPADQDARLMNVLVMERVGPIGFSAIAEGYRNYAAPGVFFVLALLGFVLGRVDRWPSTHGYQCASGVVLTGLLLHVRNSFVPLPSHFLFGFLLVGGMVLFARLRRERFSRSRN